MHSSLLLMLDSSDLSAADIKSSTQSSSILIIEHDEVNRRCQVKDPHPEMRRETEFGLCSVE